MFAHQLSVPADNRPGMLAQVTHALSEAKLNIRAITISSFGARGFFNILVDDPLLGQRALRQSGIQVELKEVIAVLIEDRPGGLDLLVGLLAKAGINIENAYGFVLESFKKAVFVIEADPKEAALAALTKAEFQTLDADAISRIEPFHYMRY